MTFDRFFGPIFPLFGWYPSPAYVLRRLQIFELLQGLHRGAALEIGCASGAFLLDLQRLGYSARGVEVSKSARELSKQTLAGSGIGVFEKGRPEWAGQFDVVAAFEVLEHIEDDLEALKEWRSYLKSGGKFLASVPAHQRFFGPEDHFWGHYRRYEREELKALLERAGFYSIEIFSWGVPFKNLTERLSAFRFRGMASSDQKSSTEISGVDRSHLRLLQRLYLSPIGKIVFSGLHGLQRIFLHSDLGRGYLISART